MPLFQYRCNDCDTDNEILVRGETSPVCPSCESDNLSKGLSHFAPMTATTPEPMGCCAMSDCCQMQDGVCPN
jgi:putative FmdB family regulatory protein